MFYLQKPEMLFQDLENAPPKVKKWRQVKIKLDEHKAVDGGFRYEEAILPDTLMYYTNGLTAKINGKTDDSYEEAVKNGQELLDFLIESAIESNENLPIPQTFSALSVA